MASPWLVALITYLVLALLVLLYSLWPLLRGVHLHPGGESFEKATLFSEEARGRLIAHYSRIQGTLAFWKTRAELYRRLHYYSVCWSIPSSVAIPFLAQAITASPVTKWFLTVVSAHTALLLAFHKALKVESNFKAFRQGESDFYDLYRRMLDRPHTFGSTERVQLDRYFDQVENLRKHIRNVEIENLPSIDQATAQLSRETPPDATDVPPPAGAT
jgi:hypothetical protein